MIENTHAAESFDTLFARLATSEFRRRFRLKAEDIAYIERKGMETIRRHAADFVRMRLAPPLFPMTDVRPDARASGLYRPARHGLLLPGMSGQVAWHSARRELATEEQRYIVAVLTAWIERNGARHQTVGISDGESVGYKTAVKR